MAEYVDAKICGVLVKGMKVMDSKYPGFDPHSKKKFKQGDQIAFKHKDRLTQEQKDAIFPNGKVYSLSVIWPLVEAKAEKQFTPSEYQEDVFRRVLETEDHLQISAYAGCAKTSTLVWIVKELAKRGLVKGKKIVYLAFNKSIQVELSDELEGTGVPAQTTHAFGFKTLTKKFGDLEPYKGRCAGNAFIQMLADDRGYDYSGKSLKAVRQTVPDYELRPAVLELVGYIKNWAVFPSFVNGAWEFSPEQEEAISDLVQKYEIEPPENYTESDWREKTIEYASRVVIRTIPLPGQQWNAIDYDDMLYLPLCLDIPFQSYDLVLTDESQDFNTCQILMLEKLIAA